MGDFPFRNGYEVGRAVGSLRRRRQTGTCTGAGAGARAARGRRQDVSPRGPDLGAGSRSRPSRPWGPQTGLSAAPTGLDYFRLDEKRAPPR